MELKSYQIWVSVIKIEIHILILSLSGIRNCLPVQNSFLTWIDTYKNQVKQLLIAANEQSTM